MSVVDGVVSAERVSGVLEYVEKHPTANPVMVLKAYQRLASTELAKGEAVVEHAGRVDDAMLAAIAAAMSRKYRPQGHRFRQAERRPDRRPAGKGEGRRLRRSSVSAQLETIAQGS